MGDNSTSVYIDPRTDFGFKFLFGTDMNKDLLISFLNALFQGRHEITDVRYLKNEHFGAYREDRRAIFDVYCETEGGERFIVEMQNVFQRFFKDRSVYYSTFPIQEQAKRGDWNFSLSPVYTVGILNFVFDEDRDNPDYFYHEVKLYDVTRERVFYDKLTYLYLELPKFTKGIGELETLMDKWVYVLKNLSRLLERPKELQERVFTRLFEAARIARFDKTARMAYEESMKNYRDITNAVETARFEGKAEGREEEKRENALNLKRMGVPVETIAAALGLSVDEVRDL